MTVFAETRIEEADIEQALAGEGEALAADDVGDAGVGGAAGAAEHVMTQVGGGEVDVAEGEGGLDPLLLPAMDPGQDVVVHQEDDVDVRAVHQVKQAAVLVPGDAAIGAGDDVEARDVEHLGGAVGGAVVGDDEVVVDGGEALEPVDQVDDGLAAVVGGDRDAEARAAARRGGHGWFFRGLDAGARAKTRRLLPEKTKPKDVTTVRSDGSARDGARNREERKSFGSRCQKRAACPLWKLIGPLRRALDAVKQGLRRRRSCGGSASRSRRCRRACRLRRCGTGRRMISARPG